MADVGLPDLLRPGLDVIFVGINPSVYSAQKGHYFARPINRFWPCLSRSVLSAKARQALGVDRLEPIHDQALLDHGMGFTDLVKCPTVKAAELSRREMDAGAGDLVGKLGGLGARVLCFQGITAYLPFHRALAFGRDKPSRGLQPQAIGSTRLFVVPNPSPANAHVSRDEQTAWYDRVAEYLGSR
jgi:double-stranded uracil-DNA glycosylase